MEILAHRGFWKTLSEKNMPAAMERAFQNGYGIETDLRDYRGGLVLSHNIAEEKSPMAEELFRLYHLYGQAGTLALNIKADGIQGLLSEYLLKYGVTNYFVFDMSIPELVACERHGLRYFTRRSDIEPECVRLDRADGIWMDSFFDDGWITAELILDYLKAEKKVCVVSPELHGNAEAGLWNRLKEIAGKSGLLLCTDYPEKAGEFFNV